MHLCRFCSVQLATFSRRLSREGSSLVIFDRRSMGTGGSCSFMGTGFPWGSCIPQSQRASEFARERQLSRRDMRSEGNRFDTCCKDSWSPRGSRVMRSGAATRDQPLVSRQRYENLQETSVSWPASLLVAGRARTRRFREIYSLRTARRLSCLRVTREPRREDDIREWSLIRLVLRLRNSR